MNVLDLSRYIIHRINESGGSVDHLKLQKLLYYIQGYTLGEYGVPAFRDEIEHWEHGPVVREVYQAYCENGYRPIASPDGESVKEPDYVLGKTIDMVIEACREKSAKELEGMTRNERPWTETRMNDTIAKEDIFRFFRENNPLGLTPPSDPFGSDPEEEDRYFDYVIKKYRKLFEALA